MKIKHRKRTPCRFHEGLADRIEEFVYQLYAKVFLLLEVDGKEFTVENIQQGFLEIGEERALRMFHHLCDPELVCPRCGLVHGTLEEFKGRLHQTLVDIRQRMDMRRLKRTIDRIRAEVIANSRQKGASV